MHMHVATYREQSRSLRPYARGRGGRLMLDASIASSLPAPRCSVWTPADRQGMSKCHLEGAFEELELR